jgi:hypothetical protein
MNKNKFRLLKTDLQNELNNLKNLEEELISIVKSLKNDPNHIELRAIGSILHDSYCCIEKMFERIAIILDEDIPEGRDWHIQLLIRMSSEIEEIRPFVISKKLLTRLKEYLRFRHLFRNIYGFELEWEKIQNLTESIPELLNLYKHEISVFIKFLDSMQNNAN